ncbi:MAG: hypothetical protein JSV85_02515 [Candidatus Bathyarchaeota archaeon]|nr:MAG: hypothetical protein JSV85_02515 [Candidatus Bathyarchaeota archaeon]
MEPLQEIDEVVDLIRDGQWHKLEDIVNKTKLTNPKTKKILEFLADYDFIDLDSKRKKVKANTALTKFLKETETR